MQTLGGCPFIHRFLSSPRFLPSDMKVPAVDTVVLFKARAQESDDMKFVGGHKGMFSLPSVKGTM